MSKRFLKERIFNIFVFSEKGVIREFGVAVYECSGDDERKLKLLQGKVKDDFARSRRFPIPASYICIDAAGTELPHTIPTDLYNELLDRNRYLHLFEDAFKTLGAPPAPLHCVTNIEGGVPQFGRPIRLPPVQC